MSEPTEITIDLIPNTVMVETVQNEVTVETIHNTVNIVDNNCPPEIEITLPVTKVVQVTSPGPQGVPGIQGIPGPLGAPADFIVTGSVSASVHLTEDIFTLTSASVDIFSINYKGVVLLKENVTTPTATRGGIFFSGSGDLFFGS